MISSIKNSKYKGRVFFVVGTGRNGTTFFYELARREPDISAYHDEHDAFSDAFFRYCKWNNLKIDKGGFLEIKRMRIDSSLQVKKYFLQSSAYLSFSILELFEDFDAKFLLLVRRPEKVVNSYIAKGWYKDKIFRRDTRLPLGYQPNFEYPGRFFSRIVPYGQGADRWEAYSQVGKISWYWKIINKTVMDLFSQIPSDHVKIVKLEDLNYDMYKSIADFFGFTPKVSRKTFEKLVQKRPNTLNPRRTVLDWDDKESNEFETEVREVAEKLGYEWRVERLKSMYLSKLKSKK